MSKEQQRLIEVDFPIREVSDASVHEKYIRKGNISALHTWWARRPLAASRATALAALIPDNARSRDELKDLVARISPWEIISDDDTKQPNPLIRKARELILDSFGGKPPRVLDCFAGGGAIPLEALRLGCETYALDYNPVAVLINKALLEYPQRYGKAVKQVSVEDGMLGLEVEHTVNPLVEAVRHWSDRVVQEASEELDRFYIKDPDGSIPVGYLWARTLTCENATCGAEIPLMHHTWLVRKSARKEALRLIPNRKKRRVDIAIARDAAIDFDPAEGTISQAHARCPVCGGTINDDTTRSLFREGKSGQRMIAVVLDHPRRTGKVFRVATSQDETLFEEARHALEEKRKKLWAEWGVDPLPDETIPTTELRRIAVPLYGLRNFADLFNARQALSLITFVEKIKAAHRQIVANTTDQDFGKAVVTYLALILDKLAMFSSTTCTWKVDTTQVVNAFVGRQAIQMTMDYFEMNPISGVSASWQNLADIALEALTPAALDTPVSVCQGSATDLPWGEGYFDAILTDPPYYDSVPYAHLADFFYIWLKRSLGDLYPDLFATPLSPKALEIVQDRKHSLSNSQKDKKYFESMLGKAFGEINRVLKPDGIAVIVFAHKTTDAWEAVINALLNAGLYLTASWPIHTEMEERLNAQETASLASSIYMVCRKRAADETGEFPKVRQEIEARIQSKLDQFWNEGVRGADFFMSAIGPAVEAFGKYNRVEKLTGDPVTVAELLEHVRKIVSEFALQRILKSVQLGGVDNPTRFYLLFRWTYNHNRVEFDEANKLAHGVGVELSALWEPSGIVKKQGEYVQLPSPMERTKDLERKGHFATMIEALQYAVWLWSRNEQTKLKTHLASTYGGNEAFWQVAQAISDVLPDGDKEKQLLQGLLYGRKGYAGGEVSQAELNDMPKKRGSK